MSGSRALGQTISGCGRNYPPDPHGHSKILGGTTLRVQCCVIMSRCCTWVQCASFPGMKAAVPPSKVTLLSEGEPHGQRPLWAWQKPGPWEEMLRAPESTQLVCLTSGTERGYLDPSPALGASTQSGPILGLHTCPPGCQNVPKSGHNSSALYMGWLSDICSFYKFTWTFCCKIYKTLLSSCRAARVLIESITRKLNLI